MEYGCLLLPEIVESLKEIEGKKAKKARKKAKKNQLKNKRFLIFTLARSTYIKKTI